MVSCLSRLIKHPFSIYFIYFISTRYETPGGRIATLRRGHRGSVFCLALNSDAIVSGSFDRSICVWDRQSSRNFPLIARLNSDGVRHTDMIYGVAINIFNQIVSSSHDSSVSVWQYDKRNVSQAYFPFISRYCDLNFVPFYMCKIPCST